MLENKPELYPVPIEAADDVNEEDTVDVVDVNVEEKGTAEVLLGSIVDSDTVNTETDRVPSLLAEKKLFYQVSL